MLYYIILYYIIFYYIVSYDTIWYDIRLYYTIDYCRYVHVYMYMYLYICICIYIYIRMYVYICIYLCIYIYVYIIYGYVYIYTHIHTYISVNCKEATTCLSIWWADMNANHNSDSDDLFFRSAWQFLTPKEFDDSFCVFYHHYNGAVAALPFPISLCVFVVQNPVQ